MTSTFDRRPAGGMGFGNGGFGKALPIRPGGVPRWLF